MKTGLWEGRQLLLTSQLVQLEKVDRACKAHTLLFRSEILGAKLKTKCKSNKRKMIPAEQQRLRFSLVLSSHLREVKRSSPNTRNIFLTLVPARLHPYLLSSTSPPQDQVFELSRHPLSHLKLNSCLSMPLAVSPHLPAGEHLLTNIGFPFSFMNLFLELC